MLITLIKICPLSTYLFHKGFKITVKSTVNFIHTCSHEIFGNRKSISILVKAQANKNMNAPTETITPHCGFYSINVFLTAGADEFPLKRFVIPMSLCSVSSRLGV